MQNIYIPVGPGKNALVQWQGKRLSELDAATQAAWEAVGATAWGRAVPTGDATGLLCIDFDADASRLYAAFARKFGDTASGLLRCVTRTPSGGCHVWLRVVGGPIDGNMKLAYVEAKNEQGREIAIETRGTGGYAIVPPTPGYTSLGDIVDVYDAPIVAAHEVLGILQYARDLCEAPLDKNQRAAEKAAPSRPIPHANSVIDIYNQTPIDEVLRECGYTIIGSRARRPGGRSLSVTIDRETNRSFHHNTNDGVHDGYWQRPFSLALYYHYGGDIRRAVRELADQLGISYEPLGGGEGPAYGGLNVVRSDQLDRVADVAYLFEGIIPRGGLSMLYGPSGCGKSFCVIDWALRLAYRGERVVYLAGEGANGYRARVNAWAQHHGMAAPGHTNLYFVLEQISLHEPDVSLRVQAMMDDIRPSLLIIDTVGQSAAGLDILAAKDAMIYLRALGMIQRHSGCAVLMVHHTNKGNSADTHAGSQYFFNNADSVFSLAPSARDDGTILLECRKLKDGERPASVAKRLVAVGESAVMVNDGDVLTLPVRTLGDNHVKILSMLALSHFYDGAPATAIERHTGLTPQAMNYALHQLKQRGLIEQTRTTFAINPSGRQALSEHERGDEPQSAPTAPEGYTPDHRGNLAALVADGDRDGAWRYIDGLTADDQMRWTQALLAMLEEASDGNL